MAAELPLANLRHQPYQLLREMERRARQSVGRDGSGSADNEWVGIGFRIGGDRFLASRGEVREVMSCPPVLTRVPGAKPWVAGLANVRGNLLTVVDLKAFLGGPPTRPGRDSRIVVINHRDLGAGLLVDEVLGFRRFDAAGRTEVRPDVELRCEGYLDGAFRQADETWPVFSLESLTDSPSFLQAAGEG
ncbi:MAG: chemotaxis protein CheW [Gammaproteobacteria bacterium]